MFGELLFWLYYCRQLRKSNLKNLKMKQPLFFSSAHQYISTFVYLIFSFFIVSIFLSCGGEEEQKEKATANDSLRGKISMSGAYALYPMAVKWTEEYNKLYPHVVFDVQAGGAGKGVADALSGTVDAGMVSRAISQEEMTKGAWPLTVAKDASIAVISDKNPNLDLILKRGLTKEQFHKIWIDGSVKTWGELLGNGGKERLQVFTRSDAGGSPETWAKYLGAKQEDLKGVGVFGDPGLAEAVAKDKLAIGFVNVNYVYDNNTKKFYEGLRPVPIDLNRNGSIDADENFYGNLDELNKAIIEGKYPSPPAKELYFVFKGKPQNHALVRFLKWALTYGQQYVATSGYVKLSDDILLRESEKLK